MSEITRFSVSLGRRSACSSSIATASSSSLPPVARPFANCSATRLTKEAWASESQDAAGTLTLVYDHHRPQLRDHLTKLQHDHTDLVVSTLHAHLTHDLCLEVIVLRGPSAKLQKIASQLRGLKGIYKGELVMASAEQH